MNKLGPALVIALGIFAVYLVLTGKASSLVAAANGNASGSSGSGSKPAATGTPVTATSVSSSAPNGSLSVQLAGVQPTNDPGLNAVIMAEFSSLADRAGVPLSFSMPQSAASNVGLTGALSDAWALPNISGSQSQPTSGGAPGALASAASIWG